MNYSIIPFFLILFLQGCYINPSEDYKKFEPLPPQDVAHLPEVLGSPFDYPPEFQQAFAKEEVTELPLSLQPIFQQKDLEQPREYDQ